MIFKTSHDWDYDVPEDEYNTARYLTFDGPLMRVCQGIFLDYQITDDDTASATRIGGLGSTGKA